MTDQRTPVLVDTLDRPGSVDTAGYARFRASSGLPTRLSAGRTAEPADVLAADGAAAGIRPSSKQHDRVGLAALVVGVVALLLDAVPGLILVAWLPALVALGLGIAGLLRRNRPRWVAAVGVALGAAALVISTVVGAALAVTVVDEIGRSSAAAAAAGSDQQAVPVDGAGAGASVDDPAPAGTAVDVTAWDGAVYSLSFGEPLWNADNAIRAENEYNAAPDTGMHYLIVPLTYTNTGATASVDPSYEAFGVSFVEPGGITRQPASVVIPNDAIDAVPILPGDSVTVNQVFQVPADTADGTWVVEGGLFVDAQ